MTIGNTEFNSDAVKQMSKEQFKKLYVGKYKGPVEIDEVYKKLTGFTQVVTKPAKSK